MFHLLHFTVVQHGNLTVILRCMTHIYDNIIRVPWITQKNDFLNSIFDSDQTELS